jgi:hypothetical protein
MNTLKSKYTSISIQRGGMNCVESQYPNRGRPDTLDIVLGGD